MKTANGYTITVKKPGRIWTLPSRTRKDHVHTVWRRADGSLGCSCEAGRAHQTCWAVKEIQDMAALEDQGMRFDDEEPKPKAKRPRREPAIPVMDPVDEPDPFADLPAKPALRIVEGDKPHRPSIAELIDLERPQTTETLASTLAA